MGAANWGGAGMSAFAASRVRTVKSGGSGKDPDEDKYWWVPLFVTVIVLILLVLLYV